MLTFKQFIKIPKDIRNDLKLIHEWIEFNGLPNEKPQDKDLKASRVSNSIDLTG